jgi:hypothetical protein
MAMANKLTLFPRFQRHLEVIGHDRGKGICICQSLAAARTPGDGFYTTEALFPGARSQKRRLSLLNFR